MRRTPLFARNHLHQPLLHRERRLAHSELQAIRYAKNVRIDGDGGAAEGDARHDVRRLPADARQFEECIIVGRHLAAELLDERAARRHDILRLIAEKSAVLYFLFKARKPQGDDGRRRRRLLEEPCRRDVHALVRALRRQDDGDQQLEGIAEMQLRLGAAVRLFEDFQLLFAYLLRDSHRVLSSSDCARAPGFVRRARRKLPS